MSGEDPNGRKAIDRMIKQMTENGVDRKYAKKKAREAAIRHDKKKQYNR